MTTYPVYICENIKTSTKKLDGSYLVLDQIKEGISIRYMVTSFKPHKDGDACHWEKEFSSLDLAEAEYNRFA